MPRNTDNTIGIIAGALLAIAGIGLICIGHAFSGLILAIIGITVFFMLLDPA